MYQVILYGCGKRCKTLLSCLPKAGIEIVGLVDENPLKWGNRLYDYTICKPETLSIYQEADICITIGNESDKTEARNIIRTYNKTLLLHEVEYIRLLIRIYEEDYKCHKKVVEMKNTATVLFDCHNGLGLGGIEEWTKNICLEFIKRNMQDFYILSPFGNYSVPNLLSDRIRYVDIDSANKFAKKTIAAIITCMENYLPCTVVTCHIDEILVAASVLKAIYPDAVRIVSVIHGGCEENYINYSALDELTDVYIGVSKDIQEALINRGISPAKVFHITCPVHCDKKLVRKYTEDYTRPLRLGYAGRIEIVQKRMDLLLRMIDILEKKTSNYVMTLAGEGSALISFQRAIEERCLEKRVICLGKIERAEIPDFWRAMDVCLNIADVEGRSISIMEAMANGAVPVVTATSGVREDITDGKNGYIVDIGAYEEMADKVYELCRHRDRLKAFGYKSHDVIYGKSQMDNHIDFWQKLLSGLWK